MRNAGKLLVLATIVAAAGSATACERLKTVTEIRTDTLRLTNTIRDTVVIHDTVRFGEFRIFNQIERLGNPLVSEALLEKRDHGFHNAGSPSTDRANFSAKIVKFITTVAGRSNSTATAIANVLLPDMITVQTDKAASSAGYLGYVFDANAYGGRKLSDDVVDASLGVVFGPLVDPNNVSPGLATDNVPAFGGGPTPGNTFPYLAPPNP